MGLNIRNIADKNIWENFLAEREEKTFLQSWNWGEFQIKMGNEIWRLGIYNDGQLISVALVIKIDAKRGTHLLVQHGPLIIQNSKIKSQNDKSKFKILEILLGEIKEIAAQENCSFVRIAPLFEWSNENQKIFKDSGFEKAPMHASAYEATWMLDITASEDELLKNMRKTTRYLIRQAMKNPDITIEKSENLNDAETYQKLNKEVAKRQNFTPFSGQYVKNEFEVFSKDSGVLLFLGKHKEEVVAGALVIFWSGIAFYHQAASLSKYAKFSIPYLLLWEAIKEAKNRGCRIFDFWGFADPQKYPKHPWAGPTLFKMGFGGYKKEYLKTQDLPLSKKYWLVYIFEKLRKIKRGL